MPEINNSASQDRVNLVYESRSGDKTEQVELPFKILVLSDYTQDDSSAIFDTQSPLVLDANNHNISTLFRQLQPSLNIEVSNKLQPGGSDLIFKMSFSELDDFTPGGVIRQLPGLQKLLEFTDALAKSAQSEILNFSDDDRGLINSALKKEGLTINDLEVNSESKGWIISSIETSISEQLDEILHHEQFSAMESGWRALSFLIDHTDFSENCEIAVLNVSKQGLIEDFEDVPEITQSRYYQLVYSDEYGQFGGRPYGAVIANYEFDHRIMDVKCLRQISSVSAVAHAPFFAAAAAELFDIDSYSRFSRLRDLASIFSQPAYVKWNAFRQLPDARYVGLTLPSFLLRNTYETEIGSLYYTETIRDKDRDLLWGNSAFAFATRLMDSFASYRWCLNCTGNTAGKVVGLNMDEGRIPTQFILTDRRESDVVAQGFIPLSVHKGDDTAAFYSAYSTQMINQDDDREGSDLSQRLSAQLPYLLIVSRISQYLKIMQRENIGSWTNRRDIDQQLNEWLLRYVSDMDNPAPGVRARRPLRHAEIKVREMEGKQDWFVSQITITPHLKYMGNSFHLSSISKMEKN